MFKSMGVLIAALALLGSPLATRAGGERDHDRARAALRAGEVLPLTTILERVAKSHPGQVLEVELERRHDRWIYELKLLERSGALVKLRVDAGDGAVIGRKSESH